MKLETTVQNNKVVLNSDLEPHLFGVDLSKWVKVSTRKRGYARKGGVNLLSLTAIFSLKFLPLIYFLIIPLWLGALDLLPWYSPNLLLEGTAELDYQYYNKVDTEDGEGRYASGDLYLSLGLRGTYDRYNVQLEVVAADSPKGLDSVRVMGRYLLYDDVIGDPLSVSLGVTLSRVWRNALHSLSVFHHGKLEAEGHLAFGKEMVCEQFWTSRWWGVAALGSADRGSPWIRFEGGWEKNYWDRYSFRLFLHSLFGFDNHNLSFDHLYPSNFNDSHSKHSRFKGYGSIKHRSIDLGGRYTHNFFEWGNLSGEYAYRLYAKNCPKNVHLVQVLWVYPFGI